VFNEAEQPVSLNNELSDLLAGAVRELGERGIDARLVPDQAEGVDAHGVLRRGDAEQSYAVRVALRPTPAAVAGLRQEVGRWLLVTTEATPAVRRACRAYRVDFVDRAGNMLIEWDGILVDVEGRRVSRSTGGVGGRPRRLFSQRGVAIVFALLCDAELVTMPYREIAERSQSSLGSVHWTMRELEQAGYVERSDTARRLHRTRQLFDRWVEGYAITLYDRLTLGHYDVDEPQRWINGNLELSADTLFGGETAAGLLDDLLRPATAVLYASTIPSRLLADSHGRRAAHGVVEIRRRFWRFGLDGDRRMVPTPLVYADLVASGDPRQMDAATRIRDTDALLRRIDKR
jgi:hypothetical protein